MKREKTPPMTLLVHDGELGDLRALLEELGTPFVERVGGLGPEDRDIHWTLVIASPKLVLDLELDQETEATRIAVIDQDSRTLRNSLRRAGITLVVRRPVHRAALRALIVHALYRGPEKRRSTRVSIGAPVRFRLGWRQHPAILTDLSVGGCRLLTDQPPARGRSFSLQIPASVAGGRAFRVKARALQAGPLGQDAARARFLTARFENVSRRQHELLKRAVSAHCDGPAIFAGSDEPGADRIVRPAAATAATAPTPAWPPAPAWPPGIAPASEAEPVAADAPPAFAPEPEPGPREAGDREAPLAAAALDEDDDFDVPVDVEIEFDDEELADADPRTAALGEVAKRVLMGQDVSLSGMRVRPNALLGIGMDLELAIHVESRELPLVVRARVHRDDGENGMVLRFHELEPDAAGLLDRLGDELPLLHTGEEGAGYLVAEILDTL